MSVVSCVSFRLTASLMGIGGGVETDGRRVHCRQGYSVVGENSRWNIHGMEKSLSHWSQWKA